MGRHRKHDGPVFYFHQCYLLASCIASSESLEMFGCDMFHPLIFLKMSSGLRFLRDPNKGEGLYILKSIS